MNTQILAMALRNTAASVRNVNVQRESEAALLRDAADLLRVLAHVVDGKALAKAFGAPGDWGYETPIGEALAAPPKPYGLDDFFREAEERGVTVAELAAALKLRPEFADCLQKGVQP